MDLKRLIAGAAVSAALVVGVAPIAHAGGPGPIPDQTTGACTGDQPSQSDTPGEGMIVVESTNGADIDCSYVSTAGAATNYVVTSLNAWEITDEEGNVLASQGNLTEGGSPTVAGSFVAPGGTLTLTVHAAIDANSGLGGAAVQAVVGSAA